MKFLSLAIFVVNSVSASTIGIDRLAVFSFWLDSHEHTIVYGSVSIESSTLSPVAGRPRYEQRIIVNVSREFETCTTSHKVEFSEATTISSFLIDRFGFGQSYGVSLDSISEHRRANDLASEINEQLKQDVFRPRDVSFDKANWRLYRPTLVDPTVAIRNDSNAYFIFRIAKGGTVETRGVISTNSFQELCSLV